MKNFSLASGLIFSIIAASSAHAAESANLLSVGAGVSSPSVTSAIGENPAGLVNNEGPKLLGSFFSPSSSFNPLGFGATFYTGNGRVGAGIGYANSGASGTNGGLSFGLAAEITSLKTALGLSGGYGLDSGTGNRTALDLGILINSHGPFRVGVVAYGLTGGVNGYGAGFSYEMNANAKLVLDAATDSTFDGKSIKPGLGITIQDFQMAFGFGMDVGDVGSGMIRNDVSVGLGYAIGRAIHIQFYYNQIAQYFGGLMFRF